MLVSNKCTLSRCMLTFGLVVLIAPAISAFGDEESNNDWNFYLRLRPRLGHFANVEGYIDLYEEYFDNVIRYNDGALKSVDINDWRRGRPTGSQCSVFLEDFQVRGYRLAKPFDIIILDACLDWLLADPNEEDSEKKIDWERLSADTRRECDDLAKDPKLKEIYETTKFKSNEVPKDLVEELHKYFSRLLKVNADNPRNWCHSLWVESYNDFIEEVYMKNCDDYEHCNYFGMENSEKDPYLKMIIDSTKQNSKVCYNVIQKQMVGLMHKDYQEKSGLNLFVTSKLAKQAKEKKWGQEMVKILQIAAGTKFDAPIKLNKVVQSLNRIKDNDEDTIERFTEALGVFALQNVDIKDTTDDEKGRNRYRKAMEKLCFPYINPKEFLKRNSKISWQLDPNSTKKPFEFYNLIYNLIRMTNYQPIYGITKDKFEHDVIEKGWVPLYLATFACQIISTTWGTIDYTTNQAAFQVNLRRDSQILIDDWPIDGITSELAKLEEDEDDDSDYGSSDEISPPVSGKKSKKSSKPAPKTSSSPKGSFGFGNLKFHKKSFFSSKKSSTTTESPQVVSSSNDDGLPEQPTKAASPIVETTVAPVTPVPAAALASPVIADPSSGNFWPTDATLGARGPIDLPTSPAIPAAGVAYPSQPGYSMASGAYGQPAQPAMGFGQPSMSYPQPAHSMGFSQEPAIGIPVQAPMPSMSISVGLPMQQPHINFGLQQTHQPMGYHQFGYGTHQMHSPQSSYPMQQPMQSHAGYAATQNYYGQPQYAQPSSPMQPVQSQGNPRDRHSRRGVFKWLPKGWSSKS